jgi:uncharacterized RDD family membrane protein YckC
MQRSSNSLEKDNIHRVLAPSRGGFLLAEFFVLESQRPRDIHDGIAWLSVLTLTMDWNVTYRQTASSKFHEI